MTSPTSTVSAADGSRNPGNSDSSAVSRAEQPGHPESDSRSNAGKTSDKEEPLTGEENSADGTQGKRARPPRRPSLDGLEEKWDVFWDEEGVYRFDASRKREEVFSIDTPPPTVSGSLHVGHMFSYTHTDIIARYQRMSGRAVFYPMGWDDNGLPTERRVQNYYGVSCDPSLPYDPDFEPPSDAGDAAAVKKREPIPVSRPNFIELCQQLTVADEKVFENLFRRIGLSVDWTRTYTTIDEHCRRVSQRAFLENLERGEAYQAEAPSLWDVTLQTAVAQAELEDRDLPGAYHRLRFARTAEISDGQSDRTAHTAYTVPTAAAADGAEASVNQAASPTAASPIAASAGHTGHTAYVVPTAAADLSVAPDDITQEVWIDTTRPELVPACVALVAHPDDERYRPLFGTTVLSPVFGVELPVLSHELADPDKGTGIAMVCTFGDVTDVTWWRELDLPVRTVLGRDGCFSEEPPVAITSDEGKAAYGRLAGKTVEQARAEIVALFTEADEIDGEPTPITHPVKFFEKGDKPLEIVSSRQWYIRNGGRDRELRDQLLERGREMNWVPRYMRTRYENWVSGLIGDWLISRQRFFGVPIPLWYRLDDSGEPLWDDPIMPDIDSLPVDPSTDVPSGWEDRQRGQPGGFVGDPDVMDTWATSSLTPQVATGWHSDEELHTATFPMDIRPQAHDIIRTWLFSSVVRAHLDTGTVPWSNCVISGFVLDPDRKKMSKSQGNVLVPTAPLERYGADAVRYWAANGRPGTDSIFDEQQLKIGRRLAVKLLNASKFVLSFAEDAESAVAGGLGAGGGDVSGITETLDRAMLHRLADVVGEATDAFTEFDYARALHRTESFFWDFTDDHIELVKPRAYGEHGPEAAQSARQGLRVALDVVQRLLAPFMPFVAEEVWNWWHDTSVHIAEWPEPESLRGLAADVDDEPSIVASSVIRAVRRVKSEAQRPLRTPVARAVVTDSAERLSVLKSVAADVKDAGRIAELVLKEGDNFNVRAELEESA